MLGDGREDVNRQLIGERIVHRDKLHTGVHEGRDECKIPGQAIELGNDELGSLFCDRLLQLRPVIAPSALDFREFRDQ